MRIGGITKDNYMGYLKLLGIKNSKSLDNLWGKNEMGEDAEFDHSYEARNARRVAAGHEDGMLIRDGDDSWRKIVPVSDEIKDKLIDTVKKQFLKNGNGMSEASDGDKSMFKNYVSGGINIKI